MLLAISLIFAMLLVWASISLILIGLVTYRYFMSMREEDQLFLDPGEAHRQRRQREVISRLARLKPYLLWTFIVWLVVGVGTFGAWMWRQLT